MVFVDYIIDSFSDICILGPPIFERGVGNNAGS
jgi:hypothetical protein